MHLAQSFGLIKKKVFQVYEERDPLHVRMVNLNSTNLKVNGGNMLKHCGARIFYLHEGCHFILLAHLTYISLSRIVHLKLLFLVMWLDCRKNEKSFDNLYNPVWKTLKKNCNFGVSDRGKWFYFIVLLGRLVSWASDYFCFKSWEKYLANSTLPFLWVFYKKPKIQTLRNLLRGPNAQNTHDAEATLEVFLVSFNITWNAIFRKWLDDCFCIVSNS